VGITPRVLFDACPRAFYASVLGRQRRALGPTRRLVVPAGVETLVLKSTVQNDAVLYLCVQTQYGAPAAQNAVFGSSPGVGGASHSFALTPLFEQILLAEETISVVTEIDTILLVQTVAV
jgi:hypothetical protein